MEKEGKLLTQNLIVYSFGHAAVDMISAIVVFSISRLNLISFNDFFNLVILYGLLAFGLQLIFGVMCDKLKAPKLFAELGIIFALLSIFFITRLPIISIVLVGIGNALFHIGGGTISLNITPKKATAPGIYVAPGALGLFAGILIGKQGLLPMGYSIILLLLTFGLILITATPKIDYRRRKTERTNIFWLIIIFILLSVIIRSFIGFMIIFPWKTNLILGIILVIGVFLGKAFGGILGDKFGWMRVGVTSLLISAFLLAFGANNPILGILGIFLFNFTMPITLVVTSNMFLGRPGFAFGLTVLALIIGALPFYAEIKILNNIFSLVTILISAVAIYVGLYFYDKFKQGRIER
jgi:FSR family fosmidomycin resistance protein-like MFS transporter